MADKKKVFIVRRPVTHPGASCVFFDWQSVEAEFDGAEIGDTISVMLGEMTAEEISEVPDFAGW
jgi:hypothetical protein